MASILIERSPLKAKIKNGNYRLINRVSTIVLDGSESIDVDDPEQKLS